MNTSTLTIEKAVQLTRSTPSTNSSTQLLKTATTQPLCKIILCTAGSANSLEKINLNTKKKTIPNSNNNYRRSRTMKTKNFNHTSRASSPPTVKHGNNANGVTTSTVISISTKECETTCSSTRLSLSISTRSPSKRTLSFTRWSSPSSSSSASA